MFDFLPPEKRKVLLDTFPWVCDFEAGKLDAKVFQQNINAFRTQLLGLKFTPAEIDSLVSVQKKGKEGMETLKKYRFPVDQLPDLASFLAAHPDDLEKMATAARERCVYLFRDGLPAVQNIINDETWPNIVKDLIRLIEAPKSHPEEPKSHPHASPLFFYGLPAVQNIINDETWPNIVKDLIELAEAAEPKDLYPFRDGLLMLAVKKQINSYDDFVLVKNRLLWALRWCKGFEEQYFVFFRGLGIFFERLGIGFFELFVMQVTEAEGFDDACNILGRLMKSTLKGIPHQQYKDLLSFIEMLHQNSTITPKLVKNRLFIKHNFGHT